MIARGSLRSSDDREDPLRILDPLAELAASWAPFASGLAWAAWCEQDRRDELAELLGDVQAEQLEAAAFEGKYCIDPPAEIVKLPTPATRPDRSAA